MGGRREVSIIFYRPVTRSDLKQERSFFRGSVSSFLQLVVASVVLSGSCSFCSRWLNYYSYSAQCIVLPDWQVTVQTLCPLCSVP